MQTVLHFRFILIRIRYSVKYTDEDNIGYEFNDGAGTGHWFYKALGVNVLI